MQYAFGDTDLAARRLQLLAQVFTESSAAFLRDAVPDETPLAVDLGCGPGYSTHLLAELLMCRHVTGLDRSEHFIALARQTETEYVSFSVHDVASAPFPVAPADFLYCRFLLTHLPEPHSVIARWATQLRPGGLLLIEEPEWIHTGVAPFATYLEIVKTMLEAQSNNLYVGPVLHDLNDSPLLQRRASHIRRLHVSNRSAATMFFMNIQTWKSQPLVQRTYSCAIIDELEADLKALTEESSDKSQIEWGLRQMVFQRV